MSVGISLLSSEIYTIFYGYSEYGSIVLRLLPFSILLTNLNFVISMVLQNLNKFKTVYISTFTGLIINAMLDIPLILLCSKIGIYPYYGAIFATLIGTSISIFISMKSLKKEMKFKYKGILDIIKKVIIPIILMSIVVFFINGYLSEIFNTRITMMITCIICALIGATIYGIVTLKNGLLYDVLGKDYVDNILRKVKLKRD